VLELEKSALRIGAIQKTSLIDYQGLISCVLFTQGCNFRCGYCHNPELLDANNWSKPLLLDTIFSFLAKRVGKLDGVVITGGEPTLHLGLPDFIKKIKNMGFKVKLDTNGTNHEMLKSLLEDFLVDYIAMDVKAPLNKYSLITGKDVRIDQVRLSIDLIMSKAPDYEFRTTIVEDQLDFEDIFELGADIKGAKRYYLQKFAPTKTNLPEFMDRQPPTDEVLNEMRVALLGFIDFVGIR
jgi:pyruvate formate lyase activating enzyme